MTGPLDVAAALAKAASELRQPRDLGATLHTIVTVARDSMTEIDHVGISVGHRGGRVVTQAATDEMVLELDRLQYELGEGPCLHAMNADTIVLVEHARHEQRWPRFIPVAAERGLRSQLGLRIHADAQVFGSLNLYSFSSDTISAESSQLAELFSVHAGMVLGHARRIENLNTALESRKVIGLALGMLMQRLDIDEDTAFAYLTRLSAASETKLRDVAASIVEEHRGRFRELPEPV